MIRIAVVGPPGAGKSHLAERLHMLTGLPLIDLDDIYWGPAWSRPGDAEWARRHNEAISQPEWIIAGNFQPQIADRLSRATHVVIVNPGVAVCLSRLVYRTLSIYAGNTTALPQQIRPHGRWSAGRGLARIAHIALRYRSVGLPVTLATAHARQLSIIRVGVRVNSRAIVGTLPQDPRKHPTNQHLPGTTDR